MSTFQIRKPAADTYHSYFRQYIDEVPDGHVLDILQSQLSEMQRLLIPIPEERSRYCYAPGKWSLKEVLGHVIDTERIFAYRALRIARNDQTPLPGFEQDDYVAAAEFNQLPWVDLVKAYEHVRVATLDLFSSLSLEAWHRSGIVSQAGVSVQALAWIICGHEWHHVMIIRSKYLV